MGNALTGISNERAVRAFVRDGWVVDRQGSRHTVLSKGTLRVAIPRHNPIKAGLLRRVIRDAGMSERQFLELL